MELMPEIHEFLELIFPVFFLQSVRFPDQILDLLRF